MTTYAYKNVIPNYTKTYGVIEIGPAGVSYSEDSIALNAYVPTYLERYVDGVLSINDIVRPDSTPITNQEIIEERARLLAAGAIYENFSTETAVSIVGVAATFTTLTPADSVASTGFLQLSSAGLHGLTNGAGLAGKKLYVTWSGGTGVTGLYSIKTVDSTLIITLDTPSTGFAAMGTAVVSLVTERIPLYTAAIPAGALGARGELIMDSVWSHTSSANAKTLNIELGGTSFGTYATPTTVASTVYQKTITNRTAASQISSALTSVGAGSVAGAVVTGTVDTTIAKNLIISGALATADEVLTLEVFSCKIEN